MVTHVFLEIKFLAIFFIINKKTGYLSVQLDYANYLIYNIGMKKLLLTATAIILCVNSASAQGLNLNSIKGIFSKPAPTQEKKQANDDSMSASEQATFFYSDNNIKNALEILLAKKESDRTPQDLVLIGNILLDQNRKSDAIFMYQRAISTDPKFYKAYYNLANIYLEDEKPFLAIENYKKVTKLKPDFAYAYYNMGCAYLKAGNLNKAKTSFIQAIEYKNTEPNFHFNLAYTYKMLNKTKLAKQYLDNYNKLMDASVNQ